MLLAIRLPLYQTNILQFFFRTACHHFMNLILQVYFNFICPCFHQMIIQSKHCSWWEKFHWFFWSIFIWLPKFMISWVIKGHIIKIFMLDLDIFESLCCGMGIKSHRLRCSIGCLAFTPGLILEIPIFLDFNWLIDHWEQESVDSLLMMICHRSIKCWISEEVHFRDCDSLKKEDCISDDFSRIWDYLTNCW